MTKTQKRCKECRDGEHSNYDDDIRLVYVKDPDGGRGWKTLLCGEHRMMRVDDGYIVKEI